MLAKPFLRMAWLVRMARGRLGATVLLREDILLVSRKPLRASSSSSSSNHCRPLPEERRVCGGRRRTLASPWCLPTRI